MVPDISRGSRTYGLLAYLYGTIVIAATINLLAGLGGLGG